MELTLTCHCGEEKTWGETPTTFPEIREQVAKDGWDVVEAHCPKHTKDGA